MITEEVPLPASLSLPQESEFWENRLSHLHREWN